MAVKNRTEATSQVGIKIVPTVTNVIHRDLLNSDILNSTVFRRDVIKTATPSVGLVDADFVDADLIKITTTSTLTISLLNLENGDVKYIEITKLAGSTISFASTIEATNFKKLITDTATSVMYIVYKKNGINYCEAVKETIIEATKSDIENSEAYKFTTAKAVADYVNTELIVAGASIDSAKWTITSLKGFVRFDKYVIFSVKLIPKTANEQALFTITSSLLKPNYNVVVSAGVKDSSVYRIVPIVINSITGVVSFANASDTITNFSVGELTLEIEYYKG